MREQDGNEDSMDLIMEATGTLNRQVQLSSQMQRKKFVSGFKVFLPLV